MKYILFIPFLLVALNAYSSPKDLMVCKRKTPSFNQFCYIDSSNQTVASSFANSFSFDLNSANDKFSGSLGDYLNKNNSGALVNVGFTPYLDFDYNWNGSADCWVDQVYNTNVFVYINGVKSENPILPNPQNEYTHFHESLLNWQTAIDSKSDQVFLNSSFNIIDGTGGDPSALRQPFQCKFNIDNIRIAFDSQEISNGLHNIRDQYTTLNRLVLTEIMFNSSLLNTQQDNKCTIVKAVDTAQNIEGVSTNDLSIFEQQYLSFLVATAAKNNTIQLNGYDPFIWLVNNEALLRQQVGADCSVQSNYFPSKESFMEGSMIINKTGYDNAMQFETDYAQLKSLSKIGWSLAFLTGNALQVAKSPEYSWLYEMPLN